MTLPLLLGVLLGISAGFATGFLLAMVRASSRAAQSHDELQRALSLANEERLRAETDAARAQSTLDAERNSFQERQQSWDQASRLMAGEFSQLSEQALNRNSELFLKLAAARMNEARQAATGDLDQRRQSIEEVLVPLREQLGRYEEGIRTLELERQRAYTGLQEQVKELVSSHQTLQGETRNLVTALRAPATRGRWGEMQLRRVVEMAGMVPHCDFDEQVVTNGEDGRLRPDMVVRLPGCKQVVVDAKVPLQAFLEANEAPDEDSRRACMVNHARQLRAHVDSLAKKAYWRQFESSPEFVVAFVPGDPLLAAALEHDPALLDHAIANHVLLTTPTTLIALLRTVGYTWQQEALAANAREIETIGRELYKRLGTFGAHMARTGRGLSSAVEAYNQAVGSLERSVLPQARRFQELGVVGAAESGLPDLDQLESSARHLQAPELVGQGLQTPEPAELRLAEVPEPEQLPDTTEVVQLRNAR